MSSPKNSTASPILADRAAPWLAGAAVVLPFLQLLPMDFDRSGPLLLLPALWFGRSQLVAGFARLPQGPIWFAVTSGLFFAATVGSVSLGAQPVPALVAASAWLVLGAGAVMAGQGVFERPDSSLTLLRGLALSGAAAPLATWFLWWNTGRGSMPIYADTRHLGLHMLSCVIAAVALAARPDLPRRNRGLWIVVGSIACGGLLWAGGRTPVLGLVAGMIVWLWRADAGQRRQLLGMSMVMILGGLLFSTLLWSPRQEYGWWTMLSRTKSSVAEGSVSALTTTRSDFWRETVERAKTAPWLGHGPDSYRYLTPKLDGQQPHNLVLQLWLELGFFGAAPALLILAAALRIGFRRATPIIEPWWILLIASVTAGMFDGVFYHILALLPALLATGILLGSFRTAAGPIRLSASRSVIGLAVPAAIAVLAVHTWLFQQVAVTSPPANAHAPVARLLRRFPSTTYGLWRWLDEWKKTDPATALEWAHWAQTRSSFAPLFHLYAARTWLEQGNRAAAKTEFDAAIFKSHRNARPQLIEMEKNLGLAEPVPVPAGKP
jgi:O-antigen ligase